MSTENFICKILTPEKTFFSGPIEMAVVPAYDGELGILKGHAPLVAKLSKGVCRITCKNSTDHFKVDGGIVKVRTKGSGDNFITEVILLSNASSFS